MPVGSAEHVQAAGRGNEPPLARCRQAEPPPNAEAQLRRITCNFVVHSLITACLHELLEWPDMLFKPMRAALPVHALPDAAMSGHLVVHVITYITLFTPSFSNCREHCRLGLN